MSRHQHEHYERAYALVRFDDFGGRPDVKVVKVLFDESSAEDEAGRLSKLNADLGARYEVQPTHVFGRPTAPVTGDQGLRDEDGP